MVDEVTVNRWLLRAVQRRGVKVFDARTITVTEAVFPCLRKAYLDRVRPLLPTPVEALKILGSELHTMLQDVLRSEGWDVEVSVGLEVGGFRLVGRVDAVRYGEGGEALEVLEIKTSNGVKEAALSSHELQLQAYLQILRARKGFLIYIDRASGRVKVFKVRPRKRALREVIERARTLHEALVENKAPPPVRGPWCRVCPHRKYCLGVRKG